MRHARHRGALIEKWKESLRSVLPITAIVIALGLLAVPAPSGAMLAFLAGVVVVMCFSPSYLVAVIVGPIWLAILLIAYQLTHGKKQQ